MALDAILWIFLGARILLPLPAVVAPPALPATQVQSAPTTPSSNPASTPQNQTGNSAAPAKPSPSSSHPRHKPSAQDCSKSKSAGNAGTAKPCPSEKGSAAKVVVKNGGSDEPSVELKPAPDEQEQRSSTEQLNAATEGNLKKIEGRPLAGAEQETLNQAKQFIDQSKAAIADGDLGRGHDLAQKARLLADELAKP